MLLEPDIRHAPIALWSIMQQFLATLRSLFGDQQNIALQQVWTAKNYNLALPWIRAGEAFLRHLLLIEAMHYSALAPAKPRASRPRQRRLVTNDPNDPESWRVSFRCFPSNDDVGPAKNGVTLSSAPQAGARPSKGEAGTEKRFFNAWPIAERIEAMLRVFNNPGGYAKRLARKLRAQPKLIRTLTKLPANAHNLVGYDGFIQAEPLCDQAEKHFEPG